MPRRRRLLTNLSKGELTPLVEGRPDLAAYFEGGSTIENFVILRQGGVTRRPGLRFISECKDHAHDAILIPFEASVDDAFVMEMGHGYARPYKNKARIDIEITSPYLEDKLRFIHFSQSVDVMWLWHFGVPQHKLVRITDTNWTLIPIRYTAVPSFESDTDISEGVATLTPGTTEGNTIVFTASTAVFKPGDIGRTIIYGASRAVITFLGLSAGDTTDPNTNVRADILDPFASIDPIPAGQWFLRGSPQVTLDPDKKEPVGSIVTLTAGASAFRPADVGKFIKIYAGLIVIKTFTSSTSVKGELLSVMTGTETANPPAAVAGSWSLEVAAWSESNGYPRTGEFYQGRLGQASTPTQKTTWWLSSSDDFDNFAIGLEADKAIEYTMATRNLNQIQWMADNIDLFIGTGGSEHRVTGGKSDEPIGGDIIPLISRQTAHGSQEIQPIVIDRRIIYVERSGLQIYAMAFDLEQDGFDSIEITGGAEHITRTGIRHGPIAIQRRLAPRLYFIRNDGTLLALTYHVREKVIGFTRIVTDGTFEAVAVKPSIQMTGNDQVWVIVKRTINGNMKRYVEMFEDNAEELASRAWQSCQTDSCKVYDLGGVATTILTGLDHLESMTVDVVTDGSYRGTAVVESGQVLLQEPAYLNAEVGLHYDSTLTTMRPGIEGEMIEGLPRSWVTLWARFFETRGGHINDEEIVYEPTAEHVLPTT